MKNVNRVSYVLVCCAMSLWMAGCKTTPSGAFGGSATPGATSTVRYRSTGIIEIDPNIPSPELAERMIAAWQAYVPTVVQDLHSERVISDAVATPEWKAHRSGPPETYIVEWKRALVVKLEPNSFDITVTYTDDGKDAKIVAPIAVQSLISSYMNICGKLRKTELLEKKNSQQHDAAMLDQKIADCDAQIGQLLQADGEELQRVFDAKFIAHVELEKKLRRDQEELSHDKAEMQKAVEREDTTPLTVTDFVRVDPVMADMYHKRSVADLQYQDLLKRLGPEHPQTKAAKELVKTCDEDLTRRFVELRKKFFLKPKPDGSGVELASRDFSAREAAVAREQELYDKQKLELDDLSFRSHKVSIIRAEKIRLEDDRRKVRNKIDELGQEIDMASNVRVIDSGGQAQIVPAGSN